MMKNGFMKKRPYYGLFIRDKMSHLGRTSHLKEILFIPGLHEKNVPLEYYNFHPT